MATIQNVVDNLESVGIFEFFLPFILIFAVVFGMLQKTQIFGKSDDKNVTKINAVIAFTFAAFIMVFPTTNAAVYDLTDYIADFVGGTLIYVLGIIVFMILLFMIATPFNKGESPELKTEHALAIGAVVAVVLVIALFISSGGSEIFPGGPHINNGLGFNFLGGGGGLFLGAVQPGVIALVLVLVVIALAVWWITKW